MKRARITMGNINAQHVAWESSSTNARGRNVLVALEDNNMIFLNLNNWRETRITPPNSGRSCPDIPLSSDLAGQCEWTVLENVGISDHLPTICYVSRGYQYEHIILNPISSWNTKKANWVRYSQYMEELEPENIATYSQFINAFNSAADEAIPKTKKTIGTKKSAKKPS